MAVKKKAIKKDTDEEVIKKTIVTKNGKVIKETIVTMKTPKKKTGGLKEIVASFIKRDDENDRSLKKWERDLLVSLRDFLTRSLGE